jgi:hypothetical protein
MSSFPTGDLVLERIYCITNVVIDPRDQAVKRCLKHSMLEPGQSASSYNAASETLLSRLHVCDKTKQSNLAILQYFLRHAACALCWCLHSGLPHEQFSAGLVQFPLCR